MGQQWFRQSISPPIASGRHTLNVFKTNNNEKNVGSFANLAFA